MICEDQKEWTWTQVWNLWEELDTHRHPYHSQDLTQNWSPAEWAKTQDNIKDNLKAQDHRQDNNLLLQDLIVVQVGDKQGV